MLVAKLPKTLHPRRARSRHRGFDIHVRRERKVEIGRNVKFSADFLKQNVTSARTTGVCTDHVSSRSDFTQNSITQQRLGRLFLAGGKARAAAVWRVNHMPDKQKYATGLLHIRSWCCNGLTNSLHYLFHILTKHAQIPIHPQLPANGVDCKRRRSRQSVAVRTSNANRAI